MPAINYDRPLRTIYSKDLSTLSLRHEEKALLVVSFLVKGVVGDWVSTSTIKKYWLKSVFKVAYHNKYLVLAEEEGWIDRANAGLVVLTDDGSDHVDGLFSTDEVNPLANNTRLIVFSPKQTHDFDKLLRQAFASATKRVRIADSYVDDTIFDSLLHVIPPNVKVELMFNHDSGPAFHATAKRFKIQYPAFTYAKYPKLHDRYIIVDDIAFIIGPSLKDAAVNSPALVVRIGTDQSKKLIDLFDNIYTKQTKIT